METTRNRKSKTKQRTSIRDVPPPSSREAVVMGMRLPDVPQHKPHRATTPEPEELILSDDEQQSTSTAAVGSVTSSYSDAPPANFGESEDADMTSSSSARTTVFEPLCYPSIPQLSDNTVCCASAIATPVHEEIRQDIIAESSITPQAPVVDAPSFYPSLSKKHFEKDRHDLLTEQHLLTFYHNPFYMISEELTNKFVQGNMVPCGPLFPLLKRLKSLCDQMVLSEAKEKENVSSISKCLHDCWTVQQQTFESRGKCGENKEASGVGCFYKSVLCIEKVDELKNLLAANRTYLLDEQICQESQFRATALQIQWIVMSINQQFFEEHGLSVHSPPTLVENAIVSSGRTLLLNSLSDIFFYLRFPSLTKRFADSLTGWAVELVCVLYKWCRCEDGQFVLNHLLRLPSPISEWAAPLLQTFIQTTRCEVRKFSARDLFLCRLTLSETEDSSWAILSNDEEEVVLVSNLLIFLVFQLKQWFPAANKGDQMMSLIAFQLLLMKILNTGLSTYCSLSYKSFCKRIGNSLRQSVRELCNHWTIARNSSQLEQDSQIQQEVDRIVLLAVHYITTRPGFGLWQFLVDLPYDVVSQNCRIRCEYLLRSTQDMELSKIYDIPISEVVKSNRTGGLKERTESIGSLDSVFLVNTLAAIVSYSLDDASYLVKELVDVCFCDGVSRDTLYKVGSEAISLLLSRRPSTFDQLLTVLDRNMTHMDNVTIMITRDLFQYAVDVLASSNLSACKLTPATLSVLGKWLINEPPDHPANRVARRVMSSLYWGPNETGDQLWLDAGVHTIAADTVMKVTIAITVADVRFAYYILRYRSDSMFPHTQFFIALTHFSLEVLKSREIAVLLSVSAHSIHCGRSNGMISKSIKKISKLASNIPNHEQLFSQFCWDILIKMKITAKENSNPPPNDLSAFFIHVAQSHLTNASVFLERGVPLMIDLIASGCSTACVVLLAKLMASHYTEKRFHVNVIVVSSFMELFDRVLHIDQCSFAVQWLVGPSSEPTPIVRLICSSISYYSKHVQDVAEYLRAWVDLLCAKRPNFWNNDNVSRFSLLLTVILSKVELEACARGEPFQATLQVLGSIARIAFLIDRSKLLGIPDIIFRLYEQVLSSWRENSRGILSMFTADQAPPPLIASSMLRVAPWASYLLLLVESKCYRDFYQHLYECLAKKENSTVEEAVKVNFVSLEVMSSSLLLTVFLSPVDLSWLSFNFLLCIQKAASKSALLLPINRLIIYRWAEFVSILSESAVLPLAVQRLATEAYHLVTVQGLYKAVSGWLFCSHEVTRRNFDFSVFDLDYLLQLILHDDTLFALTCHLGPKDPIQHVSDKFSNKSRDSRAVGFPILPTHPCLPPAPYVDRSAIFHPNSVVDMIDPLIKRLRTLAKDYVTSVDSMASEDVKFVDLVTKLHSSVVQQAPVQLRCGTRCASPYNTTIQVTSTKFNESIDAQMTYNREQRSGLLSEMRTCVLDRTAIASATFEHIARLLVRISVLHSSSYKANAQLTGGAVLKLVTSSLSGDEMLFPAAIATYEHTVRMLAEEFVRMQSQQQIPVMVLVLEGFPLSDPLIEILFSRMDT
uniref:Ectopic P granules protein 5 homolog (inferred by orthology to a human protein) n=1 Tax=Nippostrongylus brasiliensis TaxID=27835 RepID=A0A158R1S7_NIPBR